MYQLCRGITVVILVLYCHDLFAQPSDTSHSPKTQPPPKRKSFTAPDLSESKPYVPELPLVYAFGEELSPQEPGPPKFKIYEAAKGNSMGMAAGFYAEFHPPENDTIFLFDSSTDHFEEVQIHAGKEVYSGDSASVLKSVYSRAQEYDSRGNFIPELKHGVTNSTVMRSGFIPAQGFGSKRFRFSVIPGNFKIQPGAIVTASVHMLHGEGVGNILCAVTGVDYNRNMISVETSNEVPLGENINWIIVNSP